VFALFAACVCFPFLVCSAVSVFVVFSCAVSCVSMDFRLHRPATITNNYTNGQLDFMNPNAERGAANAALAAPSSRTSHASAVRHRTPGGRAHRRCRRAHGTNNSGSRTFHDSSADCDFGPDISSDRNHGSSLLLASYSDPDTSHDLTQRSEHARTRRTRQRVRRW
jgi:hypothetical protein